MATPDGLSYFFFFLQKSLVCTHVAVGACVIREGSRGFRDMDYLWDISDGMR